MKLKHETAQWTQRIQTMKIAPQGMTLGEFSASFSLSIHEAKHAALYLHRKRHIFLSEQDGQTLIFPSWKRRGRGRPAKWSVKTHLPMDERLVGLLLSAHPIFLHMKLLHQQQPKGDWRTNVDLRVKLDADFVLQFERVQTLCRDFASRNSDISETSILNALMLDQPEMMALAPEPTLMFMNGSLFAAPNSQRSERISKGTSDEDRVATYVKAAGKMGIQMSKISYNFGAKGGRAKIEKIVQELESCGLVHIYECRVHSRGRIGTRVFHTSFGEPVITASGRLIEAPEPFVG